MRRSDGGLDILSALPRDVVREIARFRVETYQSVASCCTCGRVLLFSDSAKTTLQFCAYDVLDRGQGFVFFCLSCTPRARVARRLFDSCVNAPLRASVSAAQ